MVQKVGYNNYLKSGDSILNRMNTHRKRHNNLPRRPFNERKLWILNSLT